MVFEPVGGLAFILQIFTGLTAYHFLGLDALAANLLGCAAGCVLGHFLQRVQACQSRAGTGRSSQGLPEVLLINLVPNQVIVVAIVDIGGSAYWMSLAVIVMVVPAFTSFLGRTWAFADGEIT